MMARVNLAMLAAGSIECPHDSVFWPHVGAPFEPLDYVQYLSLVHHLHPVGERRVSRYGFHVGWSAGAPFPKALYQMSSNPGKSVTGRIGPAASKRRCHENHRQD